MGKTKGEIKIGSMTFYDEATFVCQSITNIFTAWDDSNYGHVGKVRLKLKTK